MTQHNPQNQDPRGSRNEVGQGGMVGETNKIKECKICGNKVRGRNFAEHIFQEHGADAI